MSVKDLAKMMLIYQYLHMTKTRTKKVDDAYKKIKKKLNHIFTYNKALYDEANKLQGETYKTAWDNSFVKSDGKFVSMGAFIQAIYDTVEIQNLVGDKVMRKAIDSYYFDRNDTHDEKEIEEQANILADECIRLFDGERVSLFKRKLTILKQNRIIEGKVA